MLLPILNCKNASVTNKKLLRVADCAALLPFTSLPQSPHSLAWHALKGKREMECKVSKLELLCKHKATHNKANTFKNRQQHLNYTANTKHTARHSLHLRFIAMPTSDKDCTKDAFLASQRTKQKASTEANVSILVLGTLAK